MYAPDADRIAIGNFPKNTFNGPGYPILLMLISKLTGDVFIAGRYISAITAMLCGLVAFYLFRKLFRYRTALLAMPLIFVSGEFSMYSIDPASDLMFLLLCLAAVFVFIDDKIGSWAKAAIAGSICGFAYLTRYNGIFLLATCLLGIMIINVFSLQFSRRLKVATLYMLCFLAVTSPWLWFTYKHYGSPIYNTNYLNMATEFYGYRPDWDGVTAAAQSFHSFSDVILRDPQHFVLHYCVNIFRVFKRTLLESRFVFPPIAFLAFAGVVVMILKKSRKKDSFFLLSAAIYFLVMCFNHWESRYFFYLMVCYIGLACHAVVSGVDWFRKKKLLSLRTCGIIMGCIGLMLFSFSAVRANRDIKWLIKAQPLELFKASEYLKSVSGAGAKIMVRKPHLAYLSHCEQVFFVHVKSLDELNTILKKTPVDFLVYDRVALKMRPEVKILVEPLTNVSWLNPVYLDKPNSLVIYRVEKAKL
jgi:4-amino-4-deoxy-L-arabinose transferase-like glycosyltransferase